MKKKYDCRLYEYQLSDGATESVLSEIGKLIESDDQGNADAGIDFLEAINHMFVGKSIPATVMPGLHWRDRVPPNEYVLWRSCADHKFFITMKQSPVSRELRALYACPTKDGIAASVNVSLVRHSRM